MTNYQTFQQRKRQQAVKAIYGKASVNKAGVLCWDKGGHPVDLVTLELAGFNPPAVHVQAVQAWQKSADCQMAQVIDLSSRRKSA